MTREKTIGITENIIWFALLGFAFFSPWSIAGAQTFLILGLAVWLVKILISGKWKFIRTPLNIPILLYLTTQIISVIFSPFKVHSLLAFKEEWLLLLFFLVVNNIREEGKIRKLVSVLITVSCVVGLYAVWQHYSGMDLYRHKLLEPKGGVFISLGFFDHHLTFGGYYLLVFLLASVIALSYKRQGIRRILDVISPVIIGLSLIFSYARSAWLGAVTGMLTFGFLQGKKFALLFTCGVVVLCLAVFVIEPTSWERIKEISLSKDKTESTRIRLWQTSWNMIKDKPIWGIGLGNFGLLFNQYKVEGKYDNYSHPHNDFLNVAVNSGLLGLLAYLYLWVVFLYTSIKAILKNKKAGFLYSIQLGGVITMIAFLVASLFQCYYTDAEVNMLIMFLLGITTVANLKSAEVKFE
ncbi:MAG TPA: O-antigen ligase family protein [candidate division Zixibacteria bacterium]